MISIGFVIYFIAVIALTITMLWISHLLNPKKVPDRKKQIPFESGIVPAGNTDIRWNVNYFLIAISFIIFDIEAVFLYLWSIAVLDLGWPGFLTSSFFIIALLIALFYEIKQNAFHWGKPDKGA